MMAILIFVAGLYLLTAVGIVRAVRKGAAR
jgi:hypothetical protein